MSRVWTAGLFGAATMAGVIAVLALAIGLPGRAQALSGADLIALDADLTTPNTATSVSYATSENCVAITPGNSATLDIIVDAVIPYDAINFTGGLAGFGMNILFDETQLDITARATPLDATKSLLAVDAASSITSFSDPVPYNAAPLGGVIDPGDFRITELDSSTGYEDGDGRLYSLTVTADAGATVGGQLLLDLSDTDGGDGNGIPDIYNSDTSVYPIGAVWDAYVFINDGSNSNPCPAGGVSDNLSIIPQTTNTATAAFFGVNVQAGALSGLSQWDFNVTFNPAIISFDSCTEHPSTTLCNETAPGSGIIHITGTEPLPGLSGTPVLAELFFTANAEGSTGLDITITTYLDGSGSPLTPTINNGTVNVTQATPSPSPSPSPSPTGGASPTPTGTTGAGTGSPTRTPTPAGLPQTGGGTSGDSINGWLLLALLGGAAVVVAGGSLATIRARKD